MRNTGKEPDVPRCDIRYRNGQVVRGVSPASRRWTLDDPRFGVGYEFDVVEWQRA